AGTGLTGGGTSGNVTLGIAIGGVGTTQLADNAVTAAKIASGQVVKSLNGLFDSVTLAAGANVTITPSGNTLTIASSSGLATVSHDATLAGDGTGGSPLGVAVPLVLTSGSVSPVITVTNAAARGDGLLIRAGDGTMTAQGGTGAVIHG